MNIGTRLFAPDGCQFFPKGDHFYFLASTADPQRVLLVRFVIDHQSYGQVPKKAQLLQLPRLDFENACIKGLIVQAPQQTPLPPWLTFHGSVNGFLNSHEKARTYISQRLAAVELAVADWDSILMARSPLRCLKEVARTLGLNESRFTLWVLTYLVFGRNADALAPQFQNLGRWNRPDSTITKKLGRPSLAKGRHYGSNLDDSQLLRIDDAYRRFSGLGVPLTQVYTRAMLNEWGCVSVSSRPTQPELIHPAGEVFPTLDQFRYRCHKTFELEQIQIDRYGAARARQRLVGNRGSFVEACAYLYATMESDAFTTEEYPVAIDGTVLPPMFVVRVKDRASGMFVGIGCSLGAERESAYAMAAFSMAIPKVEFCAMFGLFILEQDWPCQGIPNDWIADRGPGSNLRIRSPIREMTPSFSGQSKAGIETSHPKEDKIEGAPTYKISGKTAIEMAAKIITDTIALNKSTNIRDRLSPRMRAECDLSSPLSLYEYFDRRGRTTAISIPFDNAVRQFLQKKEAVVTADGVVFLGTVFTSPKLIKTKLLAKAKAHTVPIVVYMLPFCVRHIWMEIDGELLQLTLRILHAGAEHERNVSERDLEILKGKYDPIRESRMRLIKPAAQVEAATIYENTFGRPYDTSVRKPGRPKPRSQRAKAVGQVYREITS